MKHLDDTFFALSDPTRRAILTRLERGDATVGELSLPFSISAPAISRHLRVLEAANLITREREGQHQRCRLVANQLRTAHEWLGEYSHSWSGALDRLELHLRQAPSKQHLQKQSSKKLHSISRGEKR